MSVPNTMRVGPFLPTIMAKKRHILYYIAVIWASLIPIFLEYWWFWQIFWKLNRPIFFYIYLPLFIIPFYISLVFSAIFFARILISIVNVIRKPKQGTFIRHPDDKDFRYWCIRNVIKRWPFWLAHRFPFPFLETICFKAFGVKTKLGNSLFEGWIDTEFIEFGKNVVVGQGAIIQSSVIIGNLLVVRKTIIGDDVRIGSHVLVMPGTKIGSKCIVAANSSTTVEQELENGYIYVGVPAKKFKRNIFFEDGLQDKLGQVKNVEKLREEYEKIYTKRHDKSLSIRERRELKKMSKEEEQKWYETAAEEWEEYDDGFNI
jgi:acetyltransferase-like isoleucine patch superfamily enzyme